MPSPPCFGGCNSGRCAFRLGLTCCLERPSTESSEAHRRADNARDSGKFGDDFISSGCLTRLGNGLIECRTQLRPFGKPPAERRGCTRWRRHKGSGVAFSSEMTCERLFAARIALTSEKSVRMGDYVDHLWSWIIESVSFFTVRTALVHWRCVSFQTWSRQWRGILKLNVNWRKRSNFARGRELFCRTDTTDWNDWEFDWLTDEVRRPPEYIYSEKEWGILKRVPKPFDVRCASIVTRAAIISSLPTAVLTAWFPAPLRANVSRGTKRRWITVLQIATLGKGPR